MLKRSSLFTLTLLATPLALRSATFTVLNTNLAGPGSLAQAILDANANPGADTVAFNLAAGGLTISPTNPLPLLTDSVTVDGSTQPGFSNAPLVELSGVAAGAGNVAGFLIVTDNCVIRGLAINRFSGAGIQITNGAGSRVEGCYLGVAPDGVTRHGNADAGVRIASAAYDVSTTSSNVVGGTLAAAHNLISGNNFGIYIQDSPGNSILGNYIGTDAAGAVDLGNTNSGIYVYDYLAFGNTIGGTNAGARNLISGNGEGFNTYQADGIILNYCWSNTIFGNFIGVDATGSFAIPNNEHGVNILPGGAHRVGGPNPGEGNLISGNKVNGVNIGFSGGGEVVPAFTGPVLPNGSVVQGNFIGTDVTGMSVISNQNDGVFISNAQGNTVGGSAPGEGNVISGNLNNGVEFACCGSANYNLVSANLIGITVSNALPLGNSGYGVVAGSGLNGIGGTNAGDGNVIAYNGGAGVEVYFYSVGVPILGNSIYANTNLGIDLLGNYGVDLNDPGDGDTGGNNVQNYPVLGFPLRFDSAVVVSGTLNSISNSAYRVEVFDNATNDPSGYGQGQTYLGFVEVATDTNGNGSFTFTNPATLPLTHWITATATDTNGNTSEFCFARRVSRPDSVDIAVTLTNSVNPAPRATSFFYTLTVTNNGPTNATGVVATDSLPPGLAFVSATSSQGSCTQNAGVVTCNLGSLAAGAGASVIITVNATITGTVTNAASAAANELENDPSNNSATQTTLLGIANLGVLTSDAPDPVVAGQTVTYTVVATNSGPDAATGSTLYFYLDGNNFVTGAGVSQGSVYQSGTYVACTFGSILANAGATLTVTAIPTVAGTNYNYAYGSALEFDPDNSNNSTNQPTVVLAGPGVLQFTSPTYAVNEGAGLATITVQRTGGAIGTVTVDFATSNLTALAGTDYVATNGTLVFTNGVTSNGFQVVIRDDFLSDCNESLGLRLFNATGGAVLEGTTNATLEIFDNHRVPTGLVQGVSLANTNLITTGNYGSQTPSISDDGRYVAFSSSAINLVAAPALNGNNEIFLRDRATGSNTLVSLDLTGLAAANGYSYTPQLSADGQSVAFISYANNLTTNPVSGYYQVYARNLLTGSNQLVSLNTNGAAGNSSSDSFTISSNGTKLAFRSYASDLVPGDNNNNYDIFFRDLSAGSNVLVSINSAGTGSANGYSESPTISADGRCVAFRSFASNLTPGDNNNTADIYFRDVAAGSNVLVSANPSGFAGNNYCGSDVFISGDGRYVAFESYATDLVPGPPFFNQQIFLRDTVSNRTVVVSVNNSNAVANGYCTLRGLSRDGRYALFESSANNLFTNDTDFRNHLFVRDTVSNLTMLVDINLGGTAPGNDTSRDSALSSNGRYVAFGSAATDLVAAGRQPSLFDVFLRDVQTGVTTLLSTTYGGSTGGNGSDSGSVVSANGVAAFGTDASDLVPVDGNFSTDIFARAPSETAPELLSQAIGFTGNGTASEQRISGDGTTVVFTSSAANLVPNDTNNATDVFLRDLVSGTIKLLSVNAAGNGSRDGNSDQPRPSADGRFVAFHNVPAVQPQLAKAQISFNSPFGQVYLRDSVSNVTTLLSVNKTAAAPGNGESLNPQITPDGTFTVFESVASDLVSNDLNGAVSDVFIRNRTNSLVALVSFNGAGTGSANLDSHNPAVSDDGRYVAFESYASNLGPPHSSANLDVYVRDRQTGSNILCSPNLGGTGGGDSDSFGPAISSSGRYVVFTSYADNLVTSDTNNSSDVFVFDLLMRSLRLVSGAPGGVPGDGMAQNPSLSKDGRYVAFESTSANLVANDVNGPFSDIFVRDLVSNTTALVSVNCAGSGSANDNSYTAQISGNGRYITFHSYASDLAPGDFSVYAGNVFRRDLQAGTTTLISQDRTLAGGGNLNSYDGRISDAGSTISFLSSASDLIAGDANGLDDVFAWTSMALPGVDLALTQTASLGTVVQGGSFTYTLTVTNYGLAGATGVVLTDALPASVTFVSASSSQGTVTNNGGLVTCNGGSLAAAAGLRVTLNVTAATVGSATNTASAAANETDSNLANNTASTVVLITLPSPPPLFVSVTNAHQLFLRWPSPSFGFNLETKTNLAPTVVWAPVTNSVSDNGLIRFVILDENPAERARFYRLRYP